MNVSKKPIMLSLEPRIMFDGAMASDIASAPLSNDDLDLAFIDDDEKLVDKEKITRNEVVVVDTSITNYRDILTSVGNDADVLTLQRGASLGDIALLISDYNNIDALHVFSHGGVGRLQIGSNFYDRSNIFESKEHLTSIGSKMSETGDILLYGRVFKLWYLILVRIHMSRKNRAF